MSVLWRRVRARPSMVLSLVGVAFVAFSFVALFLSWVFVIGTWFILATWSLARTERASNVPSALRRTQLIAAVTFPVLATAWKLHELERLGEERNQFANRLQHLGWAACLSAMLMPVLWPRRDVLSRAMRASWIAGVVAIAGIFGEFMEYPTHRSAMKLDPSIGRRLHTDTIADLAMNLTGSAVAIAIVLWLERQRD